MSTFSKKKFVALAEAYCLKQLAEWVASLKAKNLEEAAITYGIREGWLLPNEGLEAITVDNAFPDADVNKRANALELGAYDITELEVKMAISAAVKNGIAEANAGIEAIRALCTTAASPQPILAVKAPGTVSGSETAPKMPPVALQGPITGTVESLASQTIRLHRASIGGLDVYAIDRKHLEFMQAAQVQEAKIQVTLVQGDFGLRVLDCRLADDEK